MKKNYETPSVEKIAFQYRDQVVVASINASSCTNYTTHIPDGCKETVTERNYP